MTYKPTVEQRLDFYLNPARTALAEFEAAGVPMEEIARELSAELARSQRIAVVSVNSSVLDILTQLWEERASNIVPSIGHLEARLIENYVVPLVIALHAISSDAPVIVRLADQHHPIQFPTIGKTRRLLAAGGGILAPLNWRKHFGPLRDIALSDRPWKEKRDAIVWRGASSGPRKGVGYRLNQSRAWIADLADQHSGNSRIDVGYTKILPLKPWAQEESIKRWLKTPLSTGQQLEHKYLLSLEGNDVATGLKWMMASNSCVLMPPPSIESWFCESLLQPWEHFIPVAPDLSNVEERLDWCMSNDQEVEKIAQNGREFAQAFMDAEKEKDVLRSVLRWWGERKTIQEVLQRLAQPL